MQASKEEENLAALSSCKVYEPRQWLAYKDFLIVQ